MVRPLVANSTSAVPAPRAPTAVPAAATAPRRTWTLWPAESAIWEATVRIQISS
jgi:hypothetical protein